MTKNKQNEIVISDAKQSNMADLNNLLDELEEHLVEKADNDDEEEDRYENEGRPSIETAATEPMSSSDDWESPQRRYIDVPVALLEAKRRKEVDADIDVDVNEDAFDYLTGETTRQQEGQMNELYAKLHHFWHQEKYSPEILEYDVAMVEQIQAQIEERQEWIDQQMQDTATAVGLTAGDVSVQYLLATMAQVDLDRVKYVLGNWMAQRLSKIEAHPLHIRERIDHLSDAELEYLKEYGSLLEDHLRQTVLDQIPEAWQALDEPHMIDQPDYQGYHFWLVNSPIEVDEVEQDEGSCLVAKYSALRDFMKEGKVELQL